MESADMSIVTTSGEQMSTARSALACLVAGVVACAVFAAPAIAQGAGSAHTFLTPTDIKWGDAPPTLPKGAKIAVLHGDPGKAGPFVLRMLVPAGGYKIGPHWHTQDEQLTVISGMLYIGLADRFNKRTARALPRGGFHFLPGKEHHYAFTTGRTIIQINGDGPFDINYIDPADDPQKAKM
jgi:hypothetical protein